MTAPEPGDATAAPRVTGPGAFRRLLVGTTSANLADGLMVVAVPWLASAITRDPVPIALVTAATRLPWLLFSLPVGAITDRFDRRRLVGFAAAARAVLLLGFAVLLVVIGAPARTRRPAGGPAQRPAGITPGSCWPGSSPWPCWSAWPRWWGTTVRRR